LRHTCEPRGCGRPESSPAAALWWCCGLPLRDRSRASALRRPSVTLPSRYPADWYRRAPPPCNRKRTSHPVGKGKGHPRTGHEGPLGKYRYSSTLSLTWALDGSGWSTPRPGRFNPGKEARYPLYRRLGGPRDRSVRVRNISPATGIRSPDRPALSESLYRQGYSGPPYPVGTGGFFLVI
jgi:hypothetical protein